jgi:chemotaxis protein CheD
MIVKPDKLTNRKKIIIYAGEYTFADKAELIETTVGGCIAVCLYCQEKAFAAMAHFMLPAVRTTVDEQNEEKSKSALYGINAFKLLLDGIKKRDVDVRNCSVNLFGGADFVSEMSGSTNITLAKILFESEDIPIEKSDVGGKIIRKVLLDSYSGKIFVQQRQRMRDDER